MKTHLGNLLKHIFLVPEKLAFKVLGVVTVMIWNQSVENMLLIFFYEYCLRFSNYFSTCMSDFVVLLYSIFGVCKYGMCMIHHSDSKKSLYTIHLCTSCKLFGTYLLLIE